jgi:hypothetical protein
MAICPLVRMEFLAAMLLWKHRLYMAALCKSLDSLAELRIVSRRQSSGIQRRTQRPFIVAWAF